MAERAGKRPTKTHGTRPPEREGPDPTRLLFGLHPIESALMHAPRRVERLALTENAERRLAAALEGHRIPIERVSPRDLDKRLGPDTVHQGACADVAPLPERSLQDIAELAGPGRPIVVLDQVTDPQNVGAVLRSAAAFGAAGLVMTQRHSPPLGGVLAKSASGALEIVPVALVRNLVKALEELHTQGVVTVGLHGETEARLEDMPMDRRLALVLGAEGKGLRQLTRETCTELRRISTVDALASLNVSNAAAIALHACMWNASAGS